MKCPKCGSHNVKFHFFVDNVNEDIPMWKCLDCGNIDLAEEFFEVGDETL